jgi:hypothetical protein
MERRALLRTLGCGVAAGTSVALAGCAGDDDPTATPTPTSTGTDDPTPTDTPPARTPTGEPRYTNRGGGDGEVVVTATERRVRGHDPLTGAVRWTA